MSLIVPGSAVTAACGGKPGEKLIRPAPGGLLTVTGLTLTPPPHWHGKN